MRLPTSTLLQQTELKAKSELSATILSHMYQVKIWHSATVPKPELPRSENCGWKVVGDIVEPVLMTNESTPQVCVEIDMCNQTMGVKKV